MDGAVVCPICQCSAVSKLERLEFGFKDHIPSAVELSYCDGCDFSFTTPRDQSLYDRYYEKNSNDQIHRALSYNNTAQLNRLKDFVAANHVRSILDYGCGGGGLLGALAEAFPEVECLGFDVNANFPSDLQNLSFTNTVPDGVFDLVIASHVVEHIVDMDVVRKLFNSVKPGGSIYIEVPDVFRYSQYKKPQFLYYIDRFHINHFSQKSILKLVPNGFSVTSSGGYELPYNLGDVYPAQYLMLKKHPLYDNTAQAIEGYALLERQAAQSLRSSLEGVRFYIYGYGDNYHRNAAHGGPLTGLEENIIGIIDQKAELLNSLEPSGEKFINPDRIEAINGNVIVCTVTQFVDLSGFFKEKYPLSQIIYI